MTIRNVRLKTEGAFSILMADCDIRHFGSDTAYFKFDKKYKDHISVDASPFAAALLVPSMKLGQDLYIKGTISEELYKGLKEIVTIMASWDIGLSPISIFADHLEKDTYTPTRNALFFSGGVDSFYTYLKHKRLGDKKIDMFILANGYDITLGNDELWKTTVKTVEDVAREENIEVVKIESNVRNLIEPIMPWGYTFGGCLGALGLSLRKELKTVFISSSFKEEQLYPWGSHPQIDRLRGTETLFFDHDGTDVSRLEKIQFIAKDPLVAKNLRVCYLNRKDKFNCGVCDKCLRTMISLYIEGALEASETFPHTIDIDRVGGLVIEGEHGAIFHRENLIELEKRKMNPPLQAALRKALSNVSSHESPSMEIARKIWFYDHLYNRGRLYKLILWGRNI